MSTYIPPDQIMFAQDCFDFCVTYMFRQGKPCQKAGVNYYRLPEEELCDPIGCLISEDNYVPGIEGMYIKDVLQTYLGVKNATMIQLLARLQQVHDAKGDYATVWLSSENMAAAFNQIASWFNLSTAVLAKENFGDHR